MKKWIKNGEIYKDSIIFDGFLILNPSEELLIKAGYTEYVDPEPSLYEVRENKINEIYAYDDSSAVNEFFIGEDSIWLDKDTRTGLVLRFNAEKNAGLTDTVLWYGVKQYSLNIDDGFNMLYTIELYASNCFDVTAKHVANISLLTDKEEIEKYDYTVGYPSKVHF